MVKKKGKTIKIFQNRSHLHDQMKKTPIFSIKLKKLTTQITEKCFTFRKFENKILPQITCSGFTV